MRLDLLAFLAGAGLIVALMAGVIAGWDEAAPEGGHGVPLKEVHFHHDGVFGTYDRAQLQRGLQVYREVCSACHSLRFIAFRNLTDLGYSPEQVKVLAAEYTIEDGPNDEGEMFTRPGKPADYFPRPFPNVEAAKFANNGAAPPDLSLITKARHEGTAYVYSLLTGYEDAPAGVAVAPGQYYNPYFPGGVLSMAPPLMDDFLTFADGTPATKEQAAKDIAAFLTWAAEPRMEERKVLGTAVIVFLLIFTLIAYGSYRRIWRDDPGSARLKAAVFLASSSVS